MDNDSNVEGLFKDNIFPSESNSYVKQTLLTKRESLAKELGELDSAISRIQQEYTKKLEELQGRKKPLEEALYHVDALLRFEGYGQNDAQPVIRANVSVEANTKSTVTEVAGKKYLHSWKGLCGNIVV